jgi:hypothetical protein
MFGLTRGRTLARRGLMTSAPRAAIVLHARDGDIASKVVVRRALLVTKTSRYAVEHRRLGTETDADLEREVLWPGCCLIGWLVIPEAIFAAAGAGVGHYAAQDTAHHPRAQPPRLHRPARVSSFLCGGVG